jgi:hypothetical protein
MAISTNTLEFWHTCLKVNDNLMSLPKSIKTKLFRPFSITTLCLVFVSKFMLDHISEEETVCILADILAMGSLVLPQSHIYFIGCGTTMEPICLMPWMSAVIYRTQ